MGTRTDTLVISGVSAVLIGHLIDKFLRNLNRRRPNHQAATDGGADEMSILISHGLDIDAANKDGNTALHQALIHGNIEVTQCLMTAFPNEGLRNRSGFTALGEANRAGQTRSINHIRDFIKHEKADLLQERCDLERRRLQKLHRKKASTLAVRKGGISRLCYTDSIWPGSHPSMAHHYKNSTIQIKTGRNE